jgi:tripartite-type tricarboxylate transporter receptor subunit TctC
MRTLQFSRRLLAAGMLILVSATVSGQTASPGVAQPYPSKPIRVVTGLPGGGSDLVTRLIAQGLSANIGLPVIVDNRIIPREIVARAAPDGYTILVYGNALWLQQYMGDTVPFDPVRDYTPISLVTNAPNILVVHPSVQANSVKELIALAKAKPGVLNCSTAASGSSSHMALELFKAMAGVNVVRIPYKGNVPAVTDLMGGQVQFSFATPAAVTPYAKSGRLRLLAVTSPQPSALFPGLPTVAASGLAGFESGTITSIFGPAKTPPAIISKLNQEIVRALHRPDVKEKLIETGVDVIGSTSAQLATTMKSEMARLGKVLKDAGVRSE